MSYFPGVTPYQIVVNPLNGTTPGSGRITGIMPNASQTPGVLVGKKGASTGWTEGAITKSYTWHGQTARVAAYWSQGGDSGGPVWRNDGYGLRAVGMHVGSIYNASGQRLGAVYIPMNTLLSEWGATVPIFTAGSAARSGVAADATSSSMQLLSPDLNDLNTHVAIPDACPTNDCYVIEE